MEDERTEDDAEAPLRAATLALGESTDRLADRIDDHKNLSKDDAAFSEAPLLAATLALGESTDRLADRIVENTRLRKGLTVLIVVTCLALLAFCAIGTIVLNRVSHIDDIANRLTSEASIKDQIARADFRTDRTIFCVNSYIEASENGATYDERCPSAYPGLPISDPMAK